MSNKIIKNMRFLLIITGSVSAYKSIELVRMLVKNNHSVKIILTKSAQNFVTNMSLLSLSSDKIDVFTEDSHKMEHIYLTRECDMVIVCPASANFISKISCGIADDLASSTILAKQKGLPLIICPAMNKEMFNNDIIKGNIQKLLKSNINAEIINPAFGLLACGEEGIGKLEDINVIYYRIKSKKQNTEINNITKSAKKTLVGKSIIITLGGTVERIDDVRCITNFSSGLQGFEIANELKNLGANVTIIAGNHSVDLKDFNVIKIESARDMLNEIKNEIKKQKIDCFISSAAVCDFYVKNKKNGKIKKNKSGKIDINLKFANNPDILSEISHLKTHRPKLCIGFAAESENIIQNGIEKLKNKNCDIVVCNDISSGNIFGSYETKAVVIDNFINNTNSIKNGINQSNMIFLKKNVAKYLSSQIIMFLHKNGKE